MSGIIELEAPERWRPLGSEMFDLNSPLCAGCYGMGLWLTGFWLQDIYPFVSGLSVTMSAILGVLGLIRVSYQFHRWLRHRAAGEKHCVPSSSQDSWPPLV